jgi:hypothetical protein
MGRFSQVGIAIGMLGMVLALMGLFPQLTGAIPTIGIGIVQVLMMLGGYALLILGALIYVKTTFYLGMVSALVQSIGVRLAWTGILFASLAGLADIFGFGSHNRTANSDFYLGELQALGIIMSFFVSSFGVMLYALAGNPRLVDDEEPSTQPHVDLEKILDAQDAQTPQATSNTLTIFSETSPSETPAEISSPTPTLAPPL